MFIGHFGAALAAKRAAPKANLGVLFAAAQLVDLIWPVLLVFGVERVRITPGITTFNPLEFTHYPYTHSLLAAVFWTALAGALYFFWKRSRRDALVVAALVFSHWVLDLIVHRPDLPLWPGSERVYGFGLWNSIPGTLIVEGLIFFGGLALYVSGSRAKNRVGVWGFWGLIAFLLITYCAAAFGPPPPDANAVAWTALFIWLLPVWAWWADRARVTINRGAADSA